MSIFQTAQDQAASGQSALNDLVGEGKKFKTPDDLAKAKLESDRFIEKLQNEQRELREELAKRLSAEEALRRAQEAASTPPREPPAQSDAKPATQQAPDISSEVERVLQKREQESAVKRNIDQVTTKLQDLYGTVDKAAEVVRNKSQELGMSVDALQRLAAENPKAFFKLIGVEDKPAGDVGTSSWGAKKNATAMKSAATVSAITPGTYKYYEEIRKTDPAAYFSPRVQLQMDKDAREKGDKFYS